VVQTNPRPQGHNTADSTPTGDQTPTVDSEPTDDGATAQGAAGEIADRPQLAPGIELGGEMQDGAYEQQQWLVQRNGRFVQLTELLYRVIEQVDGQHSTDEIADQVSKTINRSVSADNVRQLVASKLIPLGLVAKADGSAVEQEPAEGGDAARSPLQINMRVRALSPRLINPFTAVLQKLFWPPVLIAMLIVAGAAQFYVFAVHGVAGGTRQVTYHPALLFAVLGMIVLGTVWHEFGHASALRYGGGEVRGMGVGFYLVYPAFYTDVTDNYRLPRWSKVRTDLGGFYFNLIFGVAMVGLYFLTSLQWLLLIVLLIDLEIFQQILPFGRYDGYWTLADITGIPDFFSRIPAFVKSMAPFVKGEDEEFSRYKRWVRVVFAMYVIVTVPMMALLFFLMIKSAPRVVGSGWDSAHQQLTVFHTAQTHADTGSMVLAIAQLLILALPAFGMVYILFNLVRRGGKALWNYSKPTPARRVKGSLIALAIVGLLGYLWAPELPASRGASGPLYAPSSWRPIGPTERGTAGDVGNSLAQVPVPYNPFRRRLVVGGIVTKPLSPTTVPAVKATARAQATAKAQATVKAKASAKAKATAKAAASPQPTTTGVATPISQPGAATNPTSPPATAVPGPALAPTQPAGAVVGTASPVPPTAPAAYAPTVPPANAPTAPPAYAPTVPPAHAPTAPPAYAPTVPPPPAKP